MDKATLTYWSGLRNAIANRAKSRQHRVVCSSGEVTNEYLDLKGMFTSGALTRNLTIAMVQYIVALDLSYPDAVGGPTMGADFVSYSWAFSQGTQWFSVRDKPKDHGLQRLIEGVQLTPDYQVILTDDVVSTGASLMRAFDAVWDTGAQIIAVIPIVDRAGVAETSFLERGVAYHPLFTHHELGIAPL